MTTKTTKAKAARTQVNKREIRSKLAKLKKAGAISPKINAATVKLTNYRLRQVKALETVLTGEAVPLRLSKADRERYAATTATRRFGSVLLVPKETNQSVDVVKRGGRDLVRIRTPLKRGEISEIILPYSAKDLIDLANKIQNDEELPNELFEQHPSDQYAFSLFGHTAKLGFPTKRELTDYILVNYKHLFDPKAAGYNSQAVKHFVLVNYGGGSGQPPEIPESIAGEKYESEIGFGRRPAINAKGRTDWFNNRQAQNKNERKKQKRQKMKTQSPAQYEKIQQANRERARKSYENKKAKDFRNAKFEA